MDRWRRMLIARFGASGVRAARALGARAVRPDAERHGSNGPTRSGWCSGRRARCASSATPTYFLHTTETGLFYPQFAFYGGSLFVATGALAIALGSAWAAFVAVLVVAVAAVYGGMVWIGSAGLGWLAREPRGARRADEPLLRHQRLRAWRVDRGRRHVGAPARARRRPGGRARRAAVGRRRGAHGGGGARRRQSQPDPGVGHDRLRRRSPDRGLGARRGRACGPAPPAARGGLGALALGAAWWPGRRSRRPRTATGPGPTRTARPSGAPGGSTGST